MDVTGARLMSRRDAMGSHRVRLHSAAHVVEFFIRRFGLLLIAHVVPFQVRDLCALCEAESEAGGGIALWRCSHVSGIRGSRAAPRRTTNSCG